jgi:hypothetical protein
MVNAGKREVCFHVESRRLSQCVIPDHMISWCYIDFKIQILDLDMHANKDTFVWMNICNVMVIKDIKVKNS